MRTRLMRLALAPMLLGLLLVPTFAGARDGEIAFPPVGSGAWQGLVFFSGYVSSDSVRDDGSFNTNVTDVIDSEIIVDLVVGDNGKVTSGTMMVDLKWVDNGVGIAPATFEPYHVVHDQHQTGTLTITGDANRLVATGTLTHTANTTSESGTETVTVEEVSGTETRDVEWVFSASEAACVRVTAQLVEATGSSLMATALIPRATVGDGREIYNGLTTHLLAWPAEVEDPEAIKEALEEIALAVEGIRLRDFPEASHLMELVTAWGDLNAKLAALDECQAAVQGWVPQSTKSWLVDILQEGLNKALDNQATYDAAELINLWVAGLSQAVMDPDLIIRFLDTFSAKLNEAIADGDTVAIYDILSFAAAYGYPGLHSKAKAALP